jgi:hypothetical protein
MGSQQGRSEILAGMKDSMREVRFTSPEGEGSIRSKLAKGGPIAVRLRTAPDSDVEGHALGDSVVLVIATFDDSDVEGHALSIHFPNAGQARRFRNEIIAAGALTATLALGVGLSQLAPSAQLGQSQVGSATQSNVVWVDTSAGTREASLSSLSVAAPAFLGVPHQVAPVEGGTAAEARAGGALGPALGGIPHQVAPDEVGGSAPAVQIPHQVPPGDL